MGERDYSSVPLQKKLGIAGPMKVALLSAPTGAAATVGTLPSGSRPATRLRPGVDLILWWPPDSDDLRRRAPSVARRTGPAGLWVLYPKRSSGVATDLSEGLIREVLLPTGLVDNKVVAFDTTWTGLRFVPRRTP